MFPVLAFSLAALGPQAPCQDLRFPVYFADGAAAVSGPAEQVLVQAASQISGCPVREVRVTPEGSAAEDGSRAAALGVARVQAVAHALATAGVDRGLIRVSTTAAAGQDLPLPPRVMVEVKVSGPPLQDPAAGRYLAAARPAARAG